jgi:hypothetical protein
LRRVNFACFLSLATLRTAALEIENMKVLILTISAVFMGLSGLATVSFAGQSCASAVVDAARLTADSDFGVDPSLMTEECIAEGSSVQSIGSDQYSVQVNCGDSGSATYDVTVSQNGDSCTAVDANQEK